MDQILKISEMVFVITFEPFELYKVQIYIPLKFVGCSVNGCEVMSKIRTVYTLSILKNLPVKEKDIASSATMIYKVKRPKDCNLINLIKKFQSKLV